MKSSHAFALTLVGWYLMLPHGGPDQTQAEWAASINSPIGQWQRFKSFDTAAECEAQAESFRSQAMGKDPLCLENALPRMIQGLKKVADHGPEVRDWKLLKTSQAQENNERNRSWKTARRSASM